MPLEEMRCPNCGGSIEIDQVKRIATCNYCGAKLRVVRKKTGNALEAIEANTEILAKESAVEHLKRRLRQSKDKLNATASLELNLNGLLGERERLYDQMETEADSALQKIWENATEPYREVKITKWSVITCTVSVVGAFYVWKIIDEALSYFWFFQEFGYLGTSRSSNEFGVLIAFLFFWLLATILSFWKLIGSITQKAKNEKTMRTADQVYQSAETGVKETIGLKYEDQLGKLNREITNKDRQLTETRRALGEEIAQVENKINELQAGINELAMEL